MWAGIKISKVPGVVQHRSTVTKKKTSKQKEDTEDIQEPEKGTRNLDVKHLTVPREQMARGNSDVKKRNYSRDYFWIINGYDNLYERDYFDNYYFCDEREIDESLGCCNCCEIL